jgi:LytS/YehU family sensor histidine kinase
MSEVYRYILESNDHKTIELSKELKFLKAFIFMMEKRYGKKLIINNMIDELQFRSMIPPMTLQLLVENAIKHNKITESEPLTISIYHTNESIIVENNLQKKRSEGGYGIGLANLRNRYKLLTGREIGIRMEFGLFTVELPIIWK